MLNNYNESPREENWQSIEAQLNEERAHQHFQSKFEGFSPMPALSNWDAVQSKLKQPEATPYKLAYRIAAAVALLVLSVSLFSDTEEVQFSDIFAGLDNKEIQEYALCQDPEIIALDIVKPVLTKSKKRKKKSTQSKQKRLLDIILAEDENIESKVDSALIAELIRPVDILPEESMFATLGGSFFYYRQGNDFKKMYYLPEVDYHLEMPVDTQDAIIYKVIRP